MIVLLFFSFLAGFVTILAPCIWPILPIALSNVPSAGRGRPLGFTLGIMTSFSVFTLSISYLGKIFHINPDIFRLIAAIIIIIFGLCMLIPALGQILEGSILNYVFKPFKFRIKNEGAGFLSGYLMGFSTGLVWAPCAGAILATIATLAATQAVNMKVVLVTLAYVCGLGVPLFIFTLAGSWCFKIMGGLSKYTLRIQQAFGLVIIIAALLIYTNYDKVVQLKILNLFPAYGSFLGGFENNQKVDKELRILRKEKKSMQKVKVKKEPLPDLGLAPEFKGIALWFNTSQVLSLSKLRGKVVLVDFWTYTCINCVRSLPHISAWYEKYKNNNFLVIGVHSPEFAFEKEVGNVEKAIRQFKVNYPVALDNDFQTWQAYENNYWPAEYLVDVSGHIRRAHFGEGNYEEMEASIRQLLEESGNSLKTTAVQLKDEPLRYGITPETYLGQARMQRFASKEEVRAGKQRFTLGASIPQDYFAYEGVWDVSGESARAYKGSALEINFLADKVFLVISPHQAGDRVKLFLDAKPVDSSVAGSDIKMSALALDSERLYNLIDLKGKVHSHLLRLEFEDDGISVYAFTFG